MPSGFRGTEVRISEISIKGRAASGIVVHYKCLFVDSEGQAHGQISHEVELSEGSKFGELAIAIRDACKEHAESVHFTDESTSQQQTEKVVIRGIAETLSEAVDSSDGVGQAG
jgi:hypothetical protein